MKLFFEKKKQQQRQTLNLIMKKYRFITLVENLYIAIGK